MAEKTKGVITESEYLKGREKASPLSEAMRLNMRTLLSRVNQLRRHWGEPMTVTSGYRPPAINTGIGKKKSPHLTCEAVDIYDPDKRLASWLLDNLELLEDLGLYLEDPDYTPNWTHLQIRAPGSGKRVFIP